MHVTINIINSARSRSECTWSGTAQPPEIKTCFFPPYLIKRVKRHSIKLNELGIMGIQHRFAKSCAGNPIISSIVRVDKCVLRQVGKKLQSTKRANYLAFHRDLRLLQFPSSVQNHYTPDRHGRCSQKRTVPPHVEMPAQQCWFKITEGLADKYMLKRCSEEYKSVLSKLNIDSYVTCVWPLHGLDARQTPVLQYDVYPSPLKERLFITLQ